MLQRFGAALIAIICLSFGLQALGLDLLSMKGLYPIEAPGGVVARLAILGVGLWLCFGLRCAGALQRRERFKHDRVR